MSKRTYVAVLALVLSLPMLAQTVPQFSADIQMTVPGGQAVAGKMYFGGEHMRMDMAMRGQQSVTISDVAKKTTYILMPQQKMYMEMSAAGMPGRRGPNTQDLKPMDPNNPCANQEGTTCKKVGSETVNGRSCDKWVFTRDSGTRTYWIDQKLHFPVKMEGQDGTTWDMKNLKEGPQAASLFEIPSDYQKMDMGGMMGGQRPAPPER